MSYGGFKTRTNNVNATKNLIKAGDAALKHVFVKNSAGASAFIGIFDAAAIADVTLGTTIPDYEIIVADAANGALALPEKGIFFDLGIVIASVTSSAGATGSANGVAVTVAFA